MKVETCAKSGENLRNSGYPRMISAANGKLVNLMKKKSLFVGLGVNKAKSFGVGRMDVDGKIFSFVFLTLFSNPQNSLLHTVSVNSGCDCCFAELAKHSLHARSYSATQEIRLIKCGGSAAGHLSTPEHEPTKTADQMKNNFVAGKNIYR